MSIADGLLGTENSVRMSNTNAMTCQLSGSMDALGHSNSHPVANKCNSELIKYQGMRWDEVFDFEKILSELRTAEKDLKTASITLTSDNKHLHQVKRLSGSDMSFYGLVPKQDANVVVVCEVCNATLNPVGLKKHMMHQHPAVWSNVSNKVPGVQSYSDSPVQATETGGEIANEIPMPIMANTSVNLSSGIASALSASTSTLSLSHHGSSSRSKSSSGGRSRSKSKHSSSNSNNVSDFVHKSSKKNLHNNASSSISGISSHKVPGSSNPYETEHQIAIYSSSSNSSCSLPSTPNKGGVAAPLDSVSISVDNMSRGLIDAREKLHADTFSFNKKKTKSPSFTGQESVDSFTSSSSSEYDRTTGLHISAPPKLSSPKTNKIPAAIARTINRGNAHHYEKHISELDRAVSSITGSHEERSDVASPPNVDVKDTKLSIFYKKKKLTSAKIDKNQSTAIVTNIAPVPLTNKIHSHTSTVAQASIRSREEKGNIVRHSFGLDEKSNAERSDRKPLHEQRHNKDRNGSVGSVEKTSASSKHFVHPAGKRMRIEESPPVEKIAPPQKISKKTVVVAEQQPTDTFEENQTSSIYIQDSVQVDTEQAIITQCSDMQQPITIDATQFQQLLFQQQQHQQDYNYTSIMMAGDLQQQLLQPTYEQHTVDEMLAEQTMEAKPQIVEKEPVKTPIAPNYDFSACKLLEANFDIHNMPSLTDDDDKDEQVSTTATAPYSMPQYELPVHDDRIVYAIAPNNEVTFVNNQVAPQIKTEIVEPSSSVEAAAISVESSTIESTESIWKDVFDQDIDIANFDLSKSKSAQKEATTQCLSGTSDYVRFVKKEHEDLNGNIMTYPGIPRPIAINTFGLVKYPQAVAGTFRKTVLTTRKANNSPTTLIGTNVHMAPRYAHSGSKVSSNYFSTLPGGSNSSLSEFCIGNMNVLSSPISSQQSQSSLSAYSIHRQANTPTGSSGSGVDCAHSPSHSSHAIQPSTSQRARQKSSASTFGALNGTSKYGPMSTVTSTMQNNSFALSSPCSGRSTAAFNSDRSNYIKRSIIANTNLIHQYHVPDSNSLSDMLSFGKTLCEMHQARVVDENGEESMAELSDRLQYIEEFYERRQNLLDVADKDLSGSRVLVSPHLQRTYSDCSIDTFSPYQYKRSATQNTDIYV